MTVRFPSVKYALDHWHASSRGIIFIVFLLASWFFFNRLEALHKMCVQMHAFNMQIIIFLTTDPESPSDAKKNMMQIAGSSLSLSLYGKCLVSLQSSQKHP